MIDLRFFPAGLPELRGRSFFAVLSDPECYRTAECLGVTMIETFMELLYPDDPDATNDDATEFLRFASDPGNWSGPDGPCVLHWPASGESGGSITFYLQTHTIP